MIKNEYNGFINIIKPTGMSSSQAVGCIKHLLNCPKVGHAGTLDPLATGVLPIMLGKATKLFNYLLDKEKEYLTEVYFGKTTDTLDSDGEIIGFSNKIPSDSEINMMIPSFIGKQNQIPPMYSALKVDGQRLYKLAREGKSLNILSRETEIYSLLKINTIGDDKVRFLIKCKSGFYVRSFCRDIGLKLNTCSLMNMLIRTKSGSFNLCNAYTLEEIKQMVLENDYSFIMSLDFPLGHYIKLELDSHYYKNLVNGVAVCYSKLFDENILNKQEIFCVYCNNYFIGIGKLNKGILKIETLINMEIK